MAKFRAPLHITIIRPFRTLAQLKTLATDLPTLVSAAGNYVITCSDQLDPATMTMTNMLEDNKTQCSNAPFNRTFVGLNAMTEVSIADDRMDLFDLAINGQDLSGSAQTVVSGITTGSAAVTTAASFALVNVGDVVTGTGIAANTTVLAKASNTALTLSNNATATNASASLTFTPSIPGLVRVSDLAGVTQGESAAPYVTAVFRPLSGDVPTTDQSRWIVYPTAALEGDMSSSYGITTQFSYKLKIVAYDAAGYGFRVLRGNTALLP